MCIWIDLVHCFAWSPASLTVQIETLDKNTVIAETSDPYVTFSIQTQLNTFANVQPNSTPRMSAFLGLTIAAAAAAAAKMTTALASSYQLPTMI